ncbi:MAG: ester cyclase [Pseudomonadales bacterium]|nr:ester cyclase [Pseudomonadales bacterium]
MPTNEEIVREACHVIWTEGQTDKVADYYAEDFQADYPTTNWGECLEGVRNLAKEVRIGLPDYREEIKLLLDSGDYIIVELLIHGTHTGPLGNMPPTGKAVSFRDVTILKLRNGKIIEQRGLSDHLSLFQQLGVTAIPPAS